MDIVDITSETSVEDYLLQVEHNKLPPKAPPGQSQKLFDKDFCEKQYKSKSLDAGGMPK
jgi:hypothetical protein